MPGVSCGNPWACAMTRSTRSSCVYEPSDSSVQPRTGKLLRSSARRSRRLGLTSTRTRDEWRRRIVRAPIQKKKRKKEKKKEKKDRAEFLRYAVRYVIALRWDIAKAFKKGSKGIIMQFLLLPHEVFEHCLERGLTPLFTLTMHGLLSPPHVLPIATSFHIRQKKNLTTNTPPFMCVGRPVPLRPFGTSGPPPPTSQPPFIASS